MSVSSTMDQGGAGGAAGVGGGVVGEVKQFYLRDVLDCGVGGGGCRKSNKGLSLGTMKKVEGNSMSSGKKGYSSSAPACKNI